MANSSGRSHPAGGCLVQGRRLLLQQGQVVDGVEHKIIPLVGAVMAGDDLGPAADDHPVHVAFYQNVPVPVGHRRRVIVGLVPDQRQRTHPARLLLAGVIGRLRQGQQGLQVPFHPLTELSE